MTSIDTVVRIRNLRLRTYIGFNPEEREKRQDVVINISFSYDASSAADSDEVAAALDYKAITKDVIAFVEDNRFLLLEKLSSDLVQRILRDREIKAVKVTVDKPHALRFADSVALEQCGLRDGVDPLALLRL
jgi:D-erythro-7,8-dihydroneopterin triphosphate epimerase